jgi:hypothetical protein
MLMTGYLFIVCLFSGCSGEGCVSRHRPTVGGNKDDVVERDASSNAKKEWTINCAALVEHCRNLDLECGSEKRKEVLSAAQRIWRGCQRNIGRCCYDAAYLTIRISLIITRHKKKLKRKYCELLKRSCQLNYWPACTLRYENCNGRESGVDVCYDSFVKSHPTAINGIVRLCKNNDEDACKEAVRVLDLLAEECKEKGKKRMFVNKARSCAKQLCKGVKETPEGCLYYSSYLQKYAKGKDHLKRAYILTRKLCYENKMGSACYGAFEIAHSYLGKDFQKLFDLRYRACLYDGDVECLEKILPECKGKISRTMKEKCKKIRVAEKELIRNQEKELQKKRCPITVEEILEGVANKSSPGCQTEK